MTWAPVTMRWPTQATQWMEGLGAAKKLAGSELASTALRLVDLEGLATTTPGPVGDAAKAAVEAGRAAMAGKLGQAPACLVITPFQPGVGQGKGYQRFLSAPNLVQLLGDKLLDSSGTLMINGEQYALVILFLSTRFEQLADSLSRFNALLPVPDLVRTEKRSRHLSRLEAEKWVLPSASALPGSLRAGACRWRVGCCCNASWAVTPSRAFMSAKTAVPPTSYWCPTSAPVSTYHHHRPTRSCM